MMQDFKMQMWCYSELREAAVAGLDAAEVYKWVKVGGLLTTGGKC